MLSGSLDGREVWGELAILQYKIKSLKKKKKEQLLSLRASETKQKQSPSWKYDVI